MRCVQQILGNSYVATQQTGQLFLLNNYLNGNNGNVTMRLIPGEIREVSGYTVVEKYNARGDR